LKKHVNKKHIAEKNSRLLQDEPREAKYICVEAAAVSKTMIQLIEQFKAQKQLANTNFTELKKPYRNAPRFQINGCRAVNKKEISSALSIYGTNKLRHIRTLLVNARVISSETCVDGDLYDFLSEITVITMSNKLQSTATCRPVVRGETELSF